MRTVLPILILVFKTLFFYSQKTQVLNESGFRHDYVVSSLQFIENPVDTPRLKYIATLQITGEQTHLLTVAGWFDLIKVKAKELGANSYLVEDYFEDEFSVNLKIRLYFAGENFIKANKLKRKTNSIFVFNQTRYNKDTASFYLNDKYIQFEPKKFYAFACDIAKPYYLATNESNITATKILFKKERAASFFIVPASKRSFVVNASALNPNSMGVAIYGVAITFRRNSAYELNYEVGRLLMEVYK
jgi:hypothetical protein